MLNKNKKQFLNLIFKNRNKGCKNEHYKRDSSKIAKDVKRSWV